MSKRASGCVAVICGLAVIATVLWLWHPLWFRYNHMIADGHNHWVPITWYEQDLRSSDPKLRARATRVIGWRAYREDVSELLAPMLQDPNANVRSWAVVGLSTTRHFQGPLQAISDQELVEQLGKLVLEDPSRSVIRRASGSLRQLISRDEVSDPELKATIEHILAEARSQGSFEKATMP